MVQLQLVLTLSINKLEGQFKEHPVVVSNHYNLLATTFHEVGGGARDVCSSPNSGCFPVLCAFTWCPTTTEIKNTTLCLERLKKKETNK